MGQACEFEEELFSNFGLGSGEGQARVSIFDDDTVAVDVEQQLEKDGQQQGQQEVLVEDEENEHHQQQRCARDHPPRKQVKMSSK
eukprot:SAG11_NODE_608_length_8226_cov_4.489603_4_plen_85_part_00